jgi:hypothetical protein
VKVVGATVDAVDEGATVVEVDVEWMIVVVGATVGGVVVVVARVVVVVGAVVVVVGLVVVVVEAVALVVVDELVGGTAVAPGARPSNTTASATSPSTAASSTSARRAVTISLRPLVWLGSRAGGVVGSERSTSRRPACRRLPDRTATDQI